MWAFSNCGEWRLLFGVRGGGLLIEEASLVVEHRFKGVQAQ